MSSGPRPLGLRPPEELGRAYEQGLEGAHRRAVGAFYTPAPVAEGLIALAVDGWDLEPARGFTVCDPAVGGGAFLLAAARMLERDGDTRASIVADRLWGADIDPGAVAVTRAALEAWAAEVGTPTEAVHVVVADTLTGGPSVWPDAPVRGFDLVVGNPPFLSQLARATVRRPDELAAVRARLGAVVTPYVDSAALFLVDACRAAGPGGRIALILPESILSSRGAGPARAAALDGGALVGVWWAAGDVFDGSVEVWAPIIERGEGSGATVRRWKGASFAPVAAVASATGEWAAGRSWGGLVAESDAPSLPRFDHSRTLGSMAEATAGFRDQFYGVAPYVSEADEAEEEGAPERGVRGRRPGSVSTRPRLVTAGLIDPLRCRWGISPTRFASSRWQAPAVDLDALRRGDPALARWADDRLVPKVVMATQTRVLEPVVDLDGSWWPSVPTIAVTPRAAGSLDDLWAIAAVLAAPPISAWALDEHRGSARSRDAIKLSAAQVLELPLPTDARAWRQGAIQAAAAQRAATEGDAAEWGAALERLGQAMTVAYGADPTVHEWWSGRRPPWRSAPRPGATVSA